MQNQEVSGHGSIRKLKGVGAVGTLALTAVAVFGTGTVSADEVSSTEASTSVATTATNAETPVTTAETKVPNGVVAPAVTTPSEVEETAKPDEGVPAETTAEMKEEAPKYVDAEKGIEKEVPAETATHTFTKAENTELTEAVKTAKENGVSVKEEVKPAIHESEEDAQKDLADQAKKVKEATKVQVGSDAIVSLDKEKATEAGLVVNNPEERKVFTDLEEMTKFVKDQSKRVASEIELKHLFDKDREKALEDLKKSGIEVVVPKEVLVEKDAETAKNTVKGIYDSVLEAIQNKADLDAQYKVLVETAKKVGLATTEGKVVTLEDASKAKADLDSQLKVVQELITKRDEANARLDSAVVSANALGIQVTLDKEVLHNDPATAVKDIEAQLASLTSLTAKVKETQGQLSKVAERSKQGGLTVSGTEVVNAKSESELAGIVAGADAKVSSALQAQSKAQFDLDKLVSDANSKGIKVTVSGKTVVAESGVAGELAKVQQAIADALTRKEQAEQAYQKAVADAQKEAEAQYQKALADANAEADRINAENVKNAQPKLSKDSTATKEGDNYKQSLKLGNKVAVSTSTTTSTEIAPMDLIAIIDGSNSFTKPFRSGDNPSREKARIALDDLEKLVTTLPEGSKVMMASYYSNGSDTYKSNKITKLLPKARALELIAGLKKDWDTSDWYRVWDRLFDQSEKAKNDLISTTELQYEDAYKQATGKNSYVSVVQFTDEWEEREVIDTSFAGWAKANAKTFMSVLYPYKDGSIASARDMAAVGHPNIYNARGKSDAQRQKDILDKFKATATETKKTTTTKTEGDGKVTITPEQGITLVSAELLSPSGKKTTLEVKDNKVQVSQKLGEDGNYTVNYVFKSSENKPASVTGTFTVSNAGSTSTTVDSAPRKMVLALDYSGSFSSEAGLAYNAKLANAIIDSMRGDDELAIIASDTDDSWYSSLARVQKATKDKAVLKRFVESLSDKNNLGKSSPEGEKPKDFLVATGYTTSTSDKNGVEKNITLITLMDNTGFGVYQAGQGDKTEDVKAFTQNGGKVLAFIPTGREVGTDGRTSELAYKSAGVTYIKHVDHIQGDASKVAKEVVDGLTKETIVETKANPTTNTATKTDKIEAGTPQVVTPKEVTKPTPKAVEKPAPVEITVNGIGLSVVETKLGTVSTNGHKVQVSTDVHPVTFKHEVKEVTFETKIQDVQAEVATHDAYVKKAKPQGKVLPNTGERASMSIAGLGILGLATAGLALTGKKRKEEN